MAWEIGCICVQLIDLVPLIIFRTVVYFIHGCWVQPLLVKVGRELKLILLKVVFCLLDVISIVHDLELDLQASLLLLEIAQGDAPHGSTQADRITLFVEIVRDVVYCPDKERLASLVSSEL